MDYQTQARETAIYDCKYSITYPCLGLMGEINEFMEKHLTAAPRDECLKELGDIAWYVSNLCSDIGVSLDSLDKRPIVFGEYITLSLEGGKICEKIKKMLRDGKELMILNELSMIWTCVERLCILHNSTLSDVLETNLAKLRSRKERGVISGSGDNR